MWMVWMDLREERSKATGKLTVLGFVGNCLQVANMEREEAKSKH